jgi:hypothetical protein
MRFFVILSSLLVAVAVSIPRAGSLPSVDQRDLGISIGDCTDEMAAEVASTCIGTASEWTQISHPHKLVLMVSLDSVLCVCVSATSGLGRRATVTPPTCAAAFTSCPIAGRTQAFECLDTQSNVESCGGCTSTDQGIDCTSIESAEDVACVMGQCVVNVCQPGWKVGANATECVEDISGNDDDRRQVLMSSLKGAARFWDV